MGDMRSGRFKARGIKGSEQFGEAGENKTLQIAVDLDIPELGRSVTTFLFMSPAAAPYSVERLRALGWKGENITDLSGIDANEVEVEVRSEMYQGKQQWRVEILTGPGRVTLSNTIDKAAFAARFASLGLGLKAGGSAPTNTAGGGGGADEPPPF